MPAGGFVSNKCDMEQYYSVEIPASVIVAEFFAICLVRTLEYRDTGHGIQFP